MHLIRLQNTKKEAALLRQPLLKKQCFRRTPDYTQPLSLHALATRLTEIT